jgi:hypothetical protein
LAKYSQKDTSMLGEWQVQTFARELEIAFGNYGKRTVGIKTIWPSTPAWAERISATLSADARTRRSGRWKSSLHASR